MSQSIGPFESVHQIKEEDKVKIFKKDKLLIPTTLTEKIKDFFSIKFKLLEGEVKDLKVKAREIQAEFKKCKKSLRELDHSLAPKISNTQTIQAQIDNIKMLRNRIQGYVGVAGEETVEGKQNEQQSKEIYTLSKLSEFLKGTKLMMFLRSEAREKKDSEAALHSKDFANLDMVFKETLDNLNFLDDLQGAENYLHTLDNKYRNLWLDYGMGHFDEKELRVRAQDVIHRLEFLKQFLLTKEEDEGYCPEKSLGDFDDCLKNIDTFISEIKKHTKIPEKGGGKGEKPQGADLAHPIAKFKDDEDTQLQAVKVWNILRSDPPHKSGINYKDFMTSNLEKIPPGKLAGKSGLTPQETRSFNLNLAAWHLMDPYRMARKDNSSVENLKLELIDVQKFMGAIAELDLIQEIRPDYLLGIYRRSIEEEDTSWIDTKVVAKMSDEQIKYFMHHVDHDALIRKALLSEVKQRHLDVSAPTKQVEAKKVENKPDHMAEFWKYLQANAGKPMLLEVVKSQIVNYSADELKEIIMHAESKLKDVGFALKIIDICIRVISVEDLKEIIQRADTELKNPVIGSKLVDHCIHVILDKKLPLSPEIMPKFTSDHYAKMTREQVEHFVDIHQSDSGWFKCIIKNGLVFSKNEQTNENVKLQLLQREEQIINQELKKGLLQIKDLPREDKGIAVESEKSRGRKLFDRFPKVSVSDKLVKAQASKKPKTTKEVAAESKKKLKQVEIDMRKMRTDLEAYALKLWSSQNINVSFGPSATYRDVIVAAQVVIADMLRVVGVQKQNFEKGSKQYLKCESLEKKLEQANGVCGKVKDVAGLRESVDLYKHMQKHVIEELDILLNGESSVSWVERQLRKFKAAMQDHVSTSKEVTLRVFQDFIGEVDSQLSRVKEAVKELKNQYVTDSEERTKLKELGLKIKEARTKCQEKVARLLQGDTSTVYAPADQTAFLDEIHNILNSQIMPEEPVVAQGPSAPLKKTSPFAPAPKDRHVEDRSVSSRASLAKAPVASIKKVPKTNL